MKYIKLFEELDIDWNFDFEEEDVNSVHDFFYDEEFDYVSDVKYKDKEIVSINLSPRRLEIESDLIEELLNRVEIYFNELSWDGNILELDDNEAGGVVLYRHNLVGYLPSLDIKNIPGFKKTNESVDIDWENFIEEEEYEKETYTGRINTEKDDYYWFVNINNGRIDYNGTNESIEYVIRFYNSSVIDDGKLFRNKDGALIKHKEFYINLSKGTDASIRRVSWMPISGYAKNDVTGERAGWDDNHGAVYYSGRGYKYLGDLHNWMETRKKY